MWGRLQPAAGFSRPSQISAELREPAKAGCRLKPAPLAAVMLVLAAVAAGMLRTFPPWRYPIYPACPIRSLTGWRCPGCGTTHALAALLAGHWSDAWHYNPMAAVAYPVLGILALVQLYSALRWNRWWRPAYRELRPLIVR